MKRQFCYRWFVLFSLLVVTASSTVVEGKKEASNESLMREPRRGLDEVVYAKGPPGSIHALILNAFWNSIFPASASEDGSDHGSMHQNVEEEVNGEFCSGMAMAMFMDGFHLSLPRNSTHSLCLSYLVRPWMLTDAGKFKGAMVFSFCMAFLTESLSAVRCKVVRHLRRQSHRKVRSWLLTILYGLQALMGYLLMFIAMTFSVELLLSSVFGLAVGHWIFFGPQTQSVAGATASRPSNQNASDDESRGLALSPAVANDDERQSLVQRAPTSRLSDEGYEDGLLIAQAPPQLETTKTGGWALTDLHLPLLKKRD